MAPLPDEVRCRWIRLTGKRCGSRVRAAGDTLCAWHEDASVARVRNWNRAATTEDVPLQQHLVMELKMSLVQLHELEFQVLDLGLSTDAWLVPTTETTKREGTSEDGHNDYVEHKQAQLLGAHPVIVQFLREREHHLRVVGVCISAGLAQRQLEVVERYVESLISSQAMLAEALGHDPSDSAVRAAIMDVVRRKQLELEDATGKPTGELAAG